MIVEIDDKDIRSLLNQLIERGENMSPVYHAIGAKLESNIRQRFDMQVDPNGSRWAALMPSTLQAYRIKYKGSIPGSLLNRTGAMLKGLSYQVQGDSVFVGFDKSYAQYHEFGTKKMARRGMLMGNPFNGQLSESDTHEIVALLNQHFFENLQNDF